MNCSCGKKYWDWKYEEQAGIVVAAQQRKNRGWIDPEVFFFVPEQCYSSPCHAASRGDVRSLG